ncbi:arsenate reductase/protein-tyrosine-phosphatase family protein [Vibrio ulleungensis]|uniref:protein-tyrosine-phosphatase n=1 Tax=Vibrio ulleungensis TaxID=2807619 RepID=A0ABS2HNA2_9VIBR|nr:low molecular weight phosphotyrosine protein phosphatase [Vibrio ulleungensis]MBM7037688.1 low molecular weight phosphotyrosine protein phosphatase [Vibrio ulleungensis]
MFSKILVVCVGNICRSPTGERKLQALLPNKTIDSAGIASAKSGLVGKPADDMAIQVSSENGLDLQGHQSKQLTAQMCAEFDLILVMEKGHIDAVCSIAPAARGKTMLFGQWLGQKEIPDPYKQSREAFDFAFELIDRAAEAWAGKL